MTPSAVCSHGRACSTSSVHGVSSTDSPASPSSAARRSTRLRSSSTSPSRASTSKAMNVAGVFSASIATRDAAGWIRWPSSSNSWRAAPAPPALALDDELAVEDVAARGELDLREVARHRLAVARLQVALAAVDEGDRAKAVPLGLICPAVAPRQRGSGPGQLGQDGRLERERHGRGIEN